MEKGITKAVKETGLPIADRDRFIAGIKSVNPTLFKAAEKAKTVDEFINKMAKGKPETVNVGVLTEFYNKVKVFNPTAPPKTKSAAKRVYSVPANIVALAEIEAKRRRMETGENINWSKIIREKLMAAFAPPEK